MLRRIARLTVLVAVLCFSASAYEPHSWPRFDESSESSDIDEMTALYRDGATIMEEGRPYRALSFNRLDLLAGPASLGPVIRFRSFLDLRSWQAGYLMQSVASGVKIVRVAAYQSLFGPHGTDYRALDILLKEALALDMRIILVLEAHDGHDSQPEGQAKDLAWYHSGYNHPYGGYRHSLPSHAGHLARRYAGHPAVAWWEIINQGSLPGHPEMAQRMLHEVSSVLKTFDPTHLVAGGMDDWQGTHVSPFVDLLSVHDDARVGTAAPEVILAAKSAGEELGKPVTVVAAALSLHQFTAETRAVEYHSRMLWAASNDVQVYGLWHYDALPLQRDSFCIEAGDPVIGALRAASSREFSMPDGKVPHVDEEHQEDHRRSIGRQPWWHVFRR